MQFQQQKAQEDRDFQQQNAEANLAFKRESLLSNEALRREQMQQARDMARANLAIRGDALADRRVDLLDKANLKNREAEDQFNRGLDVKQKALEATNRLVGDPSAKAGTPEALGNIKGLRANRGGFSTIFPNVKNASVDAEADLTTLSNLLTTENLGLLKGVLSDTDMKVLASIGSGEIQGSDKKSIAAIRRMQTALGSKLAAGRAAQQGGYNGAPPLLSDPKLQAPTSPSAAKPRLKYNPATGEFE